MVGEARQFKNKMSEKITSRLNARVKALGLNQADLARAFFGTNDLMQKHRTIINRWLKGAVTPDYTALVELSNVLDCSTDYLLGKSKNTGSN